MERSVKEQNNNKKYLRRSLKPLREMNASTNEVGILKSNSRIK